MPVSPQKVNSLQEVKSGVTLPQSRLHVFYSRQSIAEATGGGGALMQLPGGHTIFLMVGNLSLNP